MRWRRFDAVNASVEHQRLLLDIAELDRGIARAEQLRAAPPQAPRISELAAQRQEQLRELTRLTGILEDAQAQLARLESDVQLAEQRRERNAQRLAETSVAKDAQALEHEIVSLGARLTDLEDAQLEVMGTVEDAEGEVAAQQALIDQITAEGQALTTEAKAQVAAAASDIETHGRDRAALVQTLPAPLVAEYDRRAARGVGAALFRRGTCEGCQMMLSGTDVSQIRQASDEEVLFCPECGTILVRTEESGL